jgi:hypothetical protein
LERTSCFAWMFVCHFFFVVVVCEHKQCKRGTKSSKLYQFG